MRPRINCRQLYESVHGKIPDGFEVHHIIPVFAGGEDIIDNLIALSRDNHKKAHYDRWKQYGDFRDLCSYYLIGYNFTKAHQISSSVGGKKGGNKVKRLKLGICTDDPKLKRKYASAGGKVGGKVQYTKKLGIHAASREQLLEWCSKAGKASTAFQDIEMQREYGRRGGPKNKGFVWLTNGRHTIKYTKGMQENIPVDKFLKENPSYQRGRPATALVKLFECKEKDYSYVICKNGNAGYIMNVHFKKGKRNED